MSKNDPHILGKESIGKLLLQYSYPCHYRDDNYFYLQYY